MWSPDPVWLEDRYRTQSISEIAGEAGVGASTVHRALERAGVTRRRTGRRNVANPRLEDRAWLRERYATKSINEIALELGVSASTVGRAMSEVGIERRSSAGLSSRDSRLDDRAWLEERYAACSLDEIAQEVRASRSTVLRAMRRLGVERRPVARTGPRAFPHPLLNDAEHLERRYRHSTIRAVAAELAVSVDVVRRALRVHGIAPNIRHRRKDAPRPVELDSVDWLSRRYASAWSIKEIADELGVNAQMVGAALRHHGVAVRSGRGSEHPLLIDADWLASRVGVVGTDGIAIELGVARASVQRALTRYGLRSPYRLDSARLDPPTPKGLLAVWESEESIAGVARRCEVSPTTAAVWLARCGVFVSDVPAISKRDLGVAVREELTVAQMCKRFNRTGRTVIVELHRHDLFELHRRRHLRP